MSTTASPDPTMPEVRVQQVPERIEAESDALAAAPDPGRDYVVLKRGTQSSPNSPQTWEFITNINATSAAQAVTRAAEQPGTSFLNPEGPTTLVAVPIRSWNPLTLTVKVETTIVLS